MNKKIHQLVSTVWCAEFRAHVLLLITRPLKDIAQVFKLKYMPAAPSVRIKIWQTFQIFFPFKQGMTHTESKSDNLWRNGRPCSPQQNCVPLSNNWGIATSASKSLCVPIAWSHISAIQFNSYEKLHDDFRDDFRAILNKGESLSTV